MKKLKNRIKKGRDLTRIRTTDHIDEILEGDGGVAMPFLGVAPLQGLLLQLLDLVRMDLVAELRSFEHGGKIVPRNLSEPFRIVLINKKQKKKTKDNLSLFFFPLQDTRHWHR